MREKYEVTSLVVIHKSALLSGTCAEHAIDAIDANKMTLIIHKKKSLWNLHSTRKYKEKKYYILEKESEMK